MSVTSDSLTNLNFKEYTILIVDDIPANLGVISNYLQTYHFRILTARNGETALKRAQIGQPDIILLDVMLPGIDGFETCRRLKANEATQDIPVIFITALAETESKIQGFEAGAVDYVTKPLQHEEILARITTHLHLRKLTQNLQAQNQQLRQTTTNLKQANIELKKRALQQEVSRKIEHQVNVILDPDKLLKAVVALILSQFGYYFVGIWLVDREKDSLVLRVGGRQGDADWFKLDLSISLNATQSIIAQVCQTGQAYLAHNVGTDPNYLATQELPETASELALPLRVGAEEVIGVLDLQGQQVGTFDGDDKTILQTLANQIAVALRNTRLYRREKQMRALEEERAQALAKLNADKDKFFSIISHDLRNPFNSLLGNAELMLMLLDGLNKESIREMTQSIYNGARSVFNLLENLLIWSRLERGVMKCQPDEIELRALIQQTIDLLNQTAIQKNIRLSSTIGGDLRGYADKRMIETVIRNLTNNALKFTPSGGKVVISAQPGAGPGNGQTVLPPPSEFIAIAVTDTGVGIEPENINKLFRFDMHHTTPGTNEEEGTGLGLIICKEMIERNGGQIKVESTVGHGTRVEFTLPSIS